MTLWEPLHSGSMRALWAMIMLVLAGCNSVRAPSVRLESCASACESGSTRITFNLLAENPNREPLPLEEIRYEVWLDGAPVFTGTRLALATLPSFGSRALAVPAVVPREVAPGTRFRLAGEIVYRTPSPWRQTLHEAGVAYPAASLIAEGEVPAPQDAPMTK
jgi:hypothetical protein